MTGTIVPHKDFMPVFYSTTYLGPRWRRSIVQPLTWTDEPVTFDSPGVRAFDYRFVGEQDGLFRYEIG